MKLVTSGGPVPMILALLLAAAITSGSKTPSDSDKPMSAKEMELEARKAANLKRFERFDNRKYAQSTLTARGRGVKNHRRTPSTESEGTPEPKPMSLEKAIEILGSGETSPMISDTSISPASRSEATPPTYEIFDLELEEKAANDLHMSVQSLSSDTDEAYPRNIVSLSAKTLNSPTVSQKKKSDSQAQSLPIDIPRREVPPSQDTEKATQSQSTGSDMYLDRARLSRELERVRANAEHKKHKFATK